MRFLSSYFVAFLALALYGLPMASGATTCKAEIECGIVPISARGLVASTTSWLSKRLTNAERMARGMPLIPPARRNNGPDNPTPSPTPPVTHHGVLQVFSGSTSLGYVAADPNYWTPLLTPTLNNALQIEFQLPSGATSGNRIQFQQLNDGRGPIFGLVVGRDSTSSNISPGSFNYLYFDPVSAPGTAPGATPQSVPSYFSTTTGLDKQAETSVFSVNLNTGDVTVQWINTDSSTPTTSVFVQSNHLYAGGDPAAFQSRFPSPVTVVTLKFVVV